MQVYIQWTYALISINLVRYVVPFFKMTILWGSDMNHANEFQARPLIVFLKTG